MRWTEQSDGNANYHRLGKDNLLFRTRPAKFDMLSGALL